IFFFSSRRRHTRFSRDWSSTCALPISSQITIDITSRFLFEQAVFEKRAERELSADEFCQLMLDAQKQTYGDAIEERTLHPYMWRSEERRVGKEWRSRGTPKR